MTEAKVKNPKRVAAGKKAKLKGKVGEREWAKVLRAEGFEDAKRGQQNKGGEDSPDVTGIPGIHQEVKRIEAFDPYAWLAQAQRDAGPGQLPVVVHRRNNKPWMVIMPSEFFLQLVKERNNA